MAEKKSFNWISLLVGIVLIVGSIFAFMNPVATFLTLAIMLGIVAVVRGLMLIIAFFRVNDRTTIKVWFFLIVGILLTILGIIFLFRPAFAAVVFAIMVAVWFIVDAVNNLINIDRIKPAGKGIYFLSIVLNLLLLVGGIIIALHPWIVGISIPIIIGMALMASGIQHLVMAFFGPRDLV